MGIFVDHCHALIDPATGKALSGEALKAARSQQKAPRCGNKVKKSARFCNKCGSGAPNGWWKCPSCGKWVGNDSHHCWNCGAALFPDARVDMGNGVWDHQPGVIAQRFEVNEVKRLTEKGLRVGEGTMALLMRDGEYVDTLTPGRHNLQKEGSRFGDWLGSAEKSVVLIDAGSIILPVRIEGLRSAEEMDVRYYGEIIIRYNPAGAKNFLANLLKRERVLQFQDLSDLLSSEMRQALEDFCNNTTIDDIVKDPDRRIKLEKTLKETLELSSEDWSIDIVRVSSAEFYGKAYEEIRMKAGEAEAMRREMEFTEKIRELATKEKMGEFQSEHEIEEYVSSLAHERGVSDHKRMFELDRLQQTHRHEMEIVDLAHQLDEEIKKTQHDLQLSKKRDLYQREKLVEDTKAEVSAGEIALELKRKKRALEREDLEEKAKLLKGKDIQTLIGLIEDPERRKDLLKVHQNESLKGRSVEEIMALNASDSPELAKALAEIMAARHEDREANLENMRKLNAEQANQLERILEKAFKTASDAAKSGGSNTTINK